ncbi:prolipoprotein diacylglyceryl transferase [Cohnella sp. CIP 111063]|uniref:prolipoprotein diacylglyceryl transferase n=1 Tax=unclassified Cohnella TaxID=2636738 RepID=UPI000B8BE41F|nr:MULTISPECIES: prolipoprotein diacylglyceryl transferase [unclassified Cohnella]OXS54956.1 prolipoprotein diacylglyceryl transferase [Cohnella sp. CIP 111063]PRX65099.1 prolipoprotein diacylglyceryl transferase [Cohnella sp. SGD-V74]
MRVELFSIGDFAIRSYGVIVALAILMAASLAYYLARDTPYQKHIPNILVFVVLGAIIGARIWHVFFFQWGYYAKNLVQIFAIWEGGLAIQGALVGGFVVGIIYAKIHKFSFWEFADTLAPAIIFGQGIGRIACFLNGDAYGSPTGSSFGLVYPEGTQAFDRYGSQPLWPAEVWEGQWDFIVFAILIGLKNKTLPRGFLFLIYHILYALGRFSLEYLRGDSPRYAFEWTAGQWTSAVIIVTSILIMLVMTYRKNKAQTSKEVTEGLIH